MVIQCVAEVYSEAKNGKDEVRGSGYLISPSLVLTARHVVAPTVTGGRCQVRFFDRSGHQTRWCDARVVWLGNGLDAALLGPVGNAPFQKGATPAELGRIVGRIPVPVEAVGFAEALTREGRRTDTLPVSGLCHSLDSIKSDRMHIKVLWVTPEKAEDWQGESGAAVFAGDVLVGVLEAVPKAFDTDILRAVPVKALFQDTDFKTTCIETGISPELRDVNASYVSELGYSDWDDIQKRYAEEAIRTLCRFEFAGLSIEGAAEERTLNADDAYDGMRYQLDSDREKTLSLQDLLKFPAVVLLGGPGTGKSGTLKILLHHAARQKGLLPVLLPLSSLVTRPDISAATIVEAMAEQAASQCILPEATSKFFWNMLARGRCIVAFDALDEVPNPTQREKVLRAIRDLCEKAPNNRYLLTSRYNEYADTYIPSSKTDRVLFERVTMAELDETQIRDYLRVCFSDDEDIAERILAQPEPMGGPPTPLLLSVMGILARNRELPMDKFTLYDTFVQTILNSWEEMKTPDPSAPLPVVRRDAVEKLAWTAHQGDLILEDTALETLSSINGVHDPMSLLNWLTMRSGILRLQKQYGLRVTRSSYRFIHQQIEEFLAGCELAKRFSTNFDETFESFIPCVYDYRWEQVLCFATVRLQKNSDKHNRLLWKLLESAPGSDQPAFLAAKLLAECDPTFTDDAIAQAITDRMVMLCKKPEYNSIPFTRIFTLAERGFSSAYDVIEQIALGSKTSSGLLSGFDNPDSPTVDLVWFLARNAAVSAQEALDRALRKVTSLEARIRLPRCLVELGHKTKARELLVEEFTRRLDLVEAESQAFLKLLREMGSLGFIETADSLARKQLARSPVNYFSKLECALWLHEQGKIDSDYFFNLALEILSQLPREEFGNQAFHIAIDLAEKVWETDSGSARKLLCEAAVHPSCAYYLSNKFSQLENEIGDAARVGQEMLINETFDPSRLRVTVLNIIRDKNDDRAVSRMFRLLENDRVVRWAGRELFEALSDRGLGQDAMLLLTRFVAEEKRDKESRQQARQLILQYAPGKNS